MIRALIFDCFGVLVRDGWLPFREQYFWHDPVLMQEAIDSNRRVNAGLDTYDNFIDHVAILAGISPQQARAEIESSPSPNIQLLDLIHSTLKPTYKIGMLSNAAADWTNQLFTPEQVALFDKIVLSYQIGVVKPDPLAYETIAERLAVPVQECLLIDDRLSCCEGAQAVGMEAICYQDNVQLSEMFKKYNIKVR